ncbi:MAG: rod shape-determining protein [Lachnospiraceae bacterium]
MRTRRVIISKGVPLGGEQFSRDIVNTVRRAYNFSISQRTANRLKVSLADLKTQKKIAGRVAGIWLRRAGTAPGKRRFPPG